MLEMPGGNRDGIGFLVGAARCHFDATLDATLSNPDGSDLVSSCQFLLTSALQSALRRLEKTVLPRQPLVTWSWLQLLPMMWRCY